jgi:hypothetical protein
MKSKVCVNFVGITMKFLVGLTTILQCLEIAVKAGKLPKLPQSWSSDVEEALSLEFDEDATTITFP